MAKPVKIKPISSVTKDLAPTASQLGTGEIAVNINDESPALYTKANDNSVMLLADGNRLAQEAKDAADAAASSAAGKVASVGATAPVTSTGGLNPSIGITAATQSDPGSLSAGDKTKIDNLSTTYVAVAGDTMTGPLTLPADPTLDMQAATKQYVDSNIESEDFWDRVGVTDVIKTRFSADDVSIGVSDQILLESSGSATFAGSITAAGGASFGGGVFDISSSGVTTATATIQVNRTGATQSAFSAQQNGATKINLMAGGNATFEGSITATDFIDSNGYSLEKSKTALQAIKAAALDSNTDLAGLKAAIVAALVEH